MKAAKRFVTFIILLIAFGAAVYTQRVQVSDWFSEMNKPALPAEVTFDESQVEKKEVVQKSTNKLEVSATKQIEEIDSGIQKVLDEILPIKEEIVEAEGLVEEPIVEVVEEALDPNVVPVEINLGVPFTSQAPHSDWSFPYKEACEEASVLMVKEFFDGRKSGKIPADIADAGILKIVEFEKSLFGFYEDTTIEQTRDFAELMYGFDKTEIINNPTVLDIQQRLMLGLPVIVPAAGRDLGNPNFTAPGPIYHMLVIRGFTADGKFITNDPGTRNGEAYLYSFDVLMSAIHDWNGGDVAGGKKAVLVIYPN